MRPNIPRIARAVSIRPNPSEPGAAIVTIQCPYCHGVHAHGVDWQDWPAIDGHRFAHCSDAEAKKINRAGYFVRTPTTLTLQK